MFKVLVSLLLILNIASAQAQIVSHQSLKDLVDQMQFSLTVEWDQKDMNFREQTMKKFHEGLADLRKQGLTDLELIDFIKSEVKDQKLAKDIDALYAMMSNKNVPSKELELKFIEIAKKTQSRGASWDIEDLPMAAQLGIFAAGLAALYGVIFVMIHFANESSSGSGGGGGSSDPYCYEESYCTDSYYSEFYGYWIQDCTYETICQ
jgi:hypothetical protein